MPRYPSINLRALKCVLARLSGRKRSLHNDAVQLCALIQPPIHYEGLENLTLERPFVVTANHYSRPGFATSWIALGISAVLPPEVSWIMSNEWLFEGNWLAFILRPLMRFILKCINDTYSFVPMPTMVKGFSTTEQRSVGVRQAITRMRSDPHCILGITPEGMDSPDGKLMLPPPGAGRFLLHLAGMGLDFLPAAVFESDDELVIHFGKPYHLSTARDLSPAAADLAARKKVMSEIARLIS